MTTHITLTPDDIGVEFITREGKKVECVELVDDLFKFDDAYYRTSSGLSHHHLYDITARFADHT